MQATYYAFVICLTVAQSYVCVCIPRHHYGYTVSLKALLMTVSVPTQVLEKVWKMEVAEIMVPILFDMQATYTFVNYISFFYLNLYIV